MGLNEIFDGVADFLTSSGYGVIVRDVRDELANGRLR